MAETISLYSRSEIGKGNSRRLRSSGSIPAVLYGHNLPTISVSVPEKEFLQIWHRIAGKQIILDLVLHGGGKEEKRQGFLQEYQIDPLTRRFVHLDFHQVKAAEKIRMSVTVKLTGEAPGVKAGGVVDHVLREIEVEGLPRAIPEIITVDIGRLEIGDSVYVSSLDLGKEVKILVNAEEPIVSVLAPKKVEEEVPEVPVEGAEPVQPEIISEEVTEERRKKKEETTAAKPKEETKGKPKEEPKGKS